ncbi:MAG: threonine/serine exporter family protein [Bacteroidales bacterium]|nr:threonine/serine exporter family protein [Bacteroidales bacterium]
MIDDTACPTARGMCLFLADYGAALLGSGATCIRLEKNIDRIAATYGMHAEMTIMPRHLHLTVRRDDSDEIFTATTTVRTSCISFNVNTELSRLSWEIADRRIGWADVDGRYRTIVKDIPQNPWAVLALVTAANASFCRLFDGDGIAMLVVAVATMAGYYLKQQLLGRHVDVRVTFMICAFVSSVLGATDMLFGMGSTPAVAIGTSVLYLVPGIPFLNSFSDLLYRHYICSFGRFIDAMVLTACLSIGLCGGMLMMHAGMF